MTDDLFREGGPHRIRKTGPDQYAMSIKLPTDDCGRIARECSCNTCSPGYFKVKPGTGVHGDQEKAYCPYCGLAAAPKNFTTSTQFSYAKDIVRAEAIDAVEEMIKNRLNLGPSGKKKIGDGFLSIEMTHKPGQRAYVVRPFEEEIIRDVLCPQCGLDHAVYGLATWCPDCGCDIFMTHVSAEIGVIRAMLKDVDRRRELLGARVAAKDVENCLEDTVSLFEASLRALVRRCLIRRGNSAEDTDRFFKKIGTAFQNMRRTEEVLTEHFQLSLANGRHENEVLQLTKTLEKRHLIAHNLGVIDKTYLERSRSAEREGKEVLIGGAEVDLALDSCTTLVASLHERMFPKAVEM